MHGNRSSSWLNLAMLESARSPSFVPKLTACFSELASPLAEYCILQPNEVAMFDVQWICESPGKLPANDSRFVDVWANNREGEVRHLCTLDIVSHRLVSSNGP